MISQSIGTTASPVVAAVTDYLDDFARRTHSRLGEVAGVAVTMALEGDGPVTAGASTQLVRSVDALQYSIGNGPCLNALAGNGGAYIADLAGDDRWGEYGPRAASWGVLCCLSIPLPAGDPAGEGLARPDHVIAVVKVYAGKIDGLHRWQRQLGHDLTTEVAAGIRLVQTLNDTAHELDDRVQAMNSRRTIDLAVGILMERAGCEADQAFGLLRQYSQTRNVRLRDVAVELTGGPDASGSAWDPARPDGRVITELTRAARVELDPAPFRPRGAPPVR